MLLTSPSLIVFKLALMQKFPRANAVPMLALDWHRNFRPSVKFVVESAFVTLRRMTLASRMTSYTADSIHTHMRKNVPCQEFVAFAAKMILRALALFTASFSFHISAAQSQLIKDVNRTENPYIVEYSELTDDGSGNLYFISRGRELWKVNTNVLPKKAVRLRTMRRISNLTVGRRSIFFVGEDAGGTELWKTSGTVATTHKVKEIAVGSRSSNPTNLTFINGRLYFAANNGRNGTELWKSDGTSAGTVMVKDIYPGSEGSDPTGIAELNGYVYFAAKNEANALADEWYRVWDLACEGHLSRCTEFISCKTH